MKYTLSIILLALIFSSVAYSQNNNQNFIPFFNKMVDEFNSRNDFVGGLESEIQFTDGYIASSSRKFYITSGTYSKESVDSDYRQIQWEYEKHLPANIPPFFTTKLKEYEALKYSSLESRAKLRDYFRQNSENIGRYRGIPKYLPALNKILAGAKPYVRTLETEKNKFLAVKKEIMTEGRSIADKMEEESLRNAPDGEYYIALKKHMKMYKDFLEWINVKKGKVLLSEYKTKLKAFNDYEKTLRAMPKIKNPSLQSRFEGYLYQIDYYNPKLDEVVDRWEMWGKQVHPSHYRDMVGGYDNFVSAYNYFVETGNKSR